MKNSLRSTIFPSRGKDDIGFSNTSFFLKYMFLGLALNWRLGPVPRFPISPPPRRTEADEEYYLQILLKNKISQFRIIH